MAKLLPRFHIKALECLIQMDVMDHLHQTGAYLAAGNWPMPKMPIHQTLTKIWMIPLTKKTKSKAGCCSI